MLAAALALAAAASLFFPASALPASGPASGDAVPPDLEELRRARQEAWGLLVRARREEAEAVAALLAADARAERALRLLAGRRREAAAAAERAREVRRQVAFLEAEVARRRQVVDRWLRLLYEEGPVVYLDVLLGATDFYDFTTRLEVLRQVVGDAVGKLRELKEVHRHLVARRRELEAVAGRLAAAERRAAAAAAEAEAARREREAALRRARSLLGQRAAAMERLDSAWRQALPVLDRFLARLPFLAWDQVPPDAVEPDDGAGSVTVTIRQETLNAWLWQSDPGLSSLRVLLEPGRVVVTSRPPLSSLFRLEGGLRAAGGEVRLQVEALEFLDVPLGAGVLAALNSGRDLRVGLGRLAGPYRVARVEVGSGFLSLRLVR